MNLERKIELNPVFLPVNSWKGRYRLLKGSAGSGKSMNLALDFILKLSDPYYKGANLLVVRKLEEANRDSTFAELRGAVERIFGSLASQAWQITENPLGLFCKLTGCRIVFRGVRDATQREKLKSISFPKGKLTWIWCEEATELLPEDVDLLDDRLRGDLTGLNPALFYQLTLSFNPVSSSHWIKERFFDRTDPEVLTHHSTYLDNRFLDAGYRARMQRRSREDPEGYRVYGLGDWGECGGLILTRFLACEFDTERACFDSFAYGQDFGYNHANVILGVGSRDGVLYICSELYAKERDTLELIAMADQAKLDRRAEMFCDSAEPDRIKMWQRAGYRALPVKKEAGSVRAQIDFLKTCELRVHPSCVHALHELNAWRWKRDVRSGAWLDEPEEGGDDVMAALRYSVERLRRPKNAAHLPTRSLAARLSPWRLT